MLWFEFNDGSETYFINAKSHDEAFRMALWFAAGQQSVISANFLTDFNGSAVVRKVDVSGVDHSREINCELAPVAWLVR